MGLGEVHDVNVVPLAGSVRSRIVIAENAQALPLADGSLGDERHQVVGHASRKLSYQGRRMRSDRIEISEGNTLYRAFRCGSRARLGPVSGIGAHRIPQDILADLLGVSVRGSRRLARRLLGNRKLLRFAVHCRRR